jgi:hypothetical protein
VDLQEAIEAFRCQNNLERTEGMTGVKNLAKLVNALGYSDFSRYGQMPGGACMGDIFEFLSDNSGAIDALIEWIGTRNIPEWTEALSSQIEIEGEDDDEDQTGV